MSLRLSISKIKTYRECPRKYYHRHVQNLETRVKAAPLSQGDYLHKLIENFYKREKKAISIIKDYSDVVKDTLFEDEESRIMSAPDMLRIYKRYKQAYAHELKYENLGTELKLVIPAVDLFKKRLIVKNDTLFVCKIDLVLIINKGIVLFDHKFVRSVPGESMRMMDIQSTIYSVVYDLLNKGTSKKFIFNYIRSKPPTIPEVLKAGGLTRRKNLDSTADVYLEAIKENNLRKKDYLEEIDRLKGNETKFMRRVEVKKSPTLVENLLDTTAEAVNNIIKSHKDEHYPMNITRNCEQCEFKDVCALTLMGYDAQDVIDSKFIVKRKDEFKEEDE